MLGAVAAVAAVVMFLVGVLAGFVVAKRASTWCPGCGGPVDADRGISHQDRRRAVSRSTDLTHA